MDHTTRMQIANGIVAQLGGQRFARMTGAKHFTAHPDGSLSFSLPGTMTRDRVNRVLITLTPSDLFDLKFERVRGGRNPSVTLVTEVKGIYVDMLQSTFREVTGLETRLPKLIRSA